MIGTTGHLPRSSSMRTYDLRKRKARRIVAERLRVFFAALKDQLGAGAEELWKRAASQQHSSNSEGKTNEGGQGGR